MYSESFNLIIKLLSEWEGFERFVQPITEFKNFFVERCLKTYTPSQGLGAFNVLNHGDFHFKNILFKKNAESDGYEDFIVVFITFVL